ncbi:hypothetical protein WJX84_000908 [Apatococcus fuscideae]|uniref:Coilin n=1 Tax=Apatococcus fuscideae TaxID=2026836 RepID=A0AAW1T6A6_9CHLO
MYNQNATEELARLEAAFDSVKRQLFTRLHALLRQQLLTPGMLSGAQLPPISAGMPSRSLRIVLLWGVQSLKVLREGSSACWYVVPAKLKLVQDLAQQVAADFETQLPAEHLALLLKGATLLPDTPISVLQDGDQVIKAPQPSPAAAPTPLTPAAAKKGEDPPRSSRSARRKQKKRQLRRMGLLPAKPVLAQKRKAEEVEAEDITPAKVAATAAGSKQLSVKGLPKRGDDGHRRMPLKQHIVFDEPGGGQADADSHGNSHEAGLKNSQAGRGTRTALGGTVDEQVARLQAAEETSSEDEQSPDAAPRQAVDRSKAHGIANFEALPRLQRHPMYGDVLAYRLLEIGADFTPQVAEWRLGSVNSWNVKTQATVLYPWPDVNVHPVHGVGAPSSTHADQESLEDEEGPPSAYDEQGVLTAEAAAFSDRRLAQAAPDAPPNSPNPRERTPAGSSPTRRTPPLTAMDAKQPLRDDPGAAAFPEANADADAATANPNPTAVQELAAAGLLSPDAKRPAPRPRGTTDLVDSTEPAAQAASAPTLGKAADTSQTGAFQLTLRQAGSGPPKANLPVKLPPSRPGSTIPALGAWADYAAAFQKRRHELAAAKASGTSVTLPHGPPTLRSHLPGPPYPRPTPHPHPRPKSGVRGASIGRLLNQMRASGEL